MADFIQKISVRSIVEIRRVSFYKNIMLLYQKWINSGQYFL